MSSTKAQVPKTPRHQRICDLSGVANTPIKQVNATEESFAQELSVEELQQEAERKALLASILATPATKIAGDLGHLELQTPTRVKPTSPALSIYADTECRSPETPLTRAAYLKRHRRPALEWQAKKNLEGTTTPNRSRESSPESPTTRYGDENFIGIHDWPIQPDSGGIDFTEARSLGCSVGVLVRREPNSTPKKQKRKLNAASFRSPTPWRGRKRARLFSPPMPYRPNTTERAEENDEEE